MSWEFTVVQIKSPVISNRLIIDHAKNKINARTNIKQPKFTKL